MDRASAPVPARAGCIAVHSRRAAYGVGGLVGTVGRAWAVVHRAVVPELAVLAADHGAVVVGLGVAAAVVGAAELRRP